LGKFLFPVSEYVRLHITQCADLAYREVTFTWNGRQFAVASRFKHTLVLSL
jgi:hypothetical protein